MITGTIEDLKLFMSVLLAGDGFDHWQVLEAKAETFFELSLNGRIRKDFYEEDQRPARDYVLWGEIRDFLFRMIKGKRLPGLMKIVLLADEDMKEEVRKAAGPGAAEGELCMNIRYAQGKCTITSGVAYQTFTTERSLEQAWDAMLLQKLKEKGISIQ